MGNQFLFRSAFHGGEAEKSGVVAERDGAPCFVHRLGCGPGQSADLGNRAVHPIVDGRRGQLQNLVVKPGLADGELGGVHADGQSAGPGVQVVPRQRPLPAGIEVAFGVKGQRVGRDYGTPVEDFEYVFGNVAAVQGHAFPKTQSGCGATMTGAGGMSIPASPGGWTRPDCHETLAGSSTTGEPGNWISAMPCPNASTMLRRLRNS